MTGRSGRRRARAIDLSRYRPFIEEWDRFTEAASRPEPTVCRLRTGRMAEDELLGRLRRQGYRLRALEGMPTFYEVEDGPHAVSLTLEHWLGLLYVQQASTGLAAPALGLEPGERVLDLCAAPGGKTTHLAELMHGRGCLVASEVDERRIRGLLGNVYRLGITNVMVVACDGRSFPEGARFDRVLVDAPCSGEGTLRRRAGQAPNQSASFLGYITRVQSALLERAIQLTRPGGTVLYVTCTFSPDENEAIVSDALERGGIELEPLDLAVPHARGLVSFGEQRFDERLRGAVRIYPHHLDSGGLFMARLRRRAGPEPASGWTPVPSAYPDGGMSNGEARSLAERVRSTLESRYGIRSEGAWGWIVRGGRVWLQTAGEWPVSAWEEGAWRVICLGIRAVELDSRERPRPTNDLLRLAGDRLDLAALDVTREQLRTLLGRRAVPVETEGRGPVAVRYRGDVVGRGAVGAEGLKSEIPKARAADLARALA